MTAENAQREPTMEEILASIRRIISEEDQPEGAEADDVLELQPGEPDAEASAPPVMKEAEPAPAPKAAPEPAPHAEPAFDVAEHVARAPEPVRPMDDDLMIVENEEEAPPPAAPAPKAASRPMSDDALVSEPTATKAAGALGKLMGSMLVSNGGTLDDVVRELLKPMLKEWLDANLTAIVEAEVAKEIERIRRMAR